MCNLHEDHFLKKILIPNWLFLDRPLCNKYSSYLRWKRVDAYREAAKKVFSLMAFTLYPSSVLTISGGTFLRFPLQENGL